MENSEFLLVEHSVIDDNDLVAMYRKFKEDIQEKKRKLEGIARKADGDYLSLLLAKLSYKFSKEEYDVLSTEIKRRGIII